MSVYSCQFSVFSCQRVVKVSNDSNDLKDPSDSPLQRLASQGTCRVAVGSPGRATAPPCLVSGELPLAPTTACESTRRDVVARRASSVFSRGVERSETPGKVAFS
ncbi:MAG: hypothetical protein J6B03_02130 [Candidatus Homeothermus sp.]|nr:hypothetical protein [Candidatus Homeothermus sp.]